MCYLPNSQFVKLLHACVTAFNIAPPAPLLLLGAPLAAMPLLLPSGLPDTFTTKLLLAAYAVVAAPGGRLTGAKQFQPVTVLIISCHQVAARSHL
jgi:hypothetical protein